MKNQKAGDAFDAARRSKALKIEPPPVGCDTREHNSRGAGRTGGWAGVGGGRSYGLLPFGLVHGDRELLLERFAVIRVSLLALLLAQQPFDVAARLLERQASSIAAFGETCEVDCTSRLNRAGD